MRMTQKQVVLMTCLANKNSDGSHLDLDELLSRLRDEYRWDTSKPSLQFSIRRLVAEGIIEKQAREKRRSRQRAVLALTDLGMKVLGR
jgi:DNA-binding PadR family transcriptional regulator